MDTDSGEMNVTEQGEGGFGKDLKVPLSFAMKLKLLLCLKTPKEKQQLI